MNARVTAAVFLVGALAGCSVYDPSLLSDGGGGEDSREAAPPLDVGSPFLVDRVAPPFDAGVVDVSMVDAPTDAPTWMEASLDAPDESPSDAPAVDAPVTPAFVQSGTSYDFNDCQSTAGVQLTSPVASGDLLIVAVGYAPFGNGPFPPETMAVSDTLGSTFTQLDDVFSQQDDLGVRTFVAPAAMAGPSDSITVSYAPCTTYGLTASDYSGVSSVASHNMVLQASAPTTTGGVAVEISSGTGGTLVWALSVALDGEGSFVAGPGFTARGPSQGDWPDTNGLTYGRTEDAPFTGGAMAVATWTINNSTDMVNTAILMQ